MVGLGFCGECLLDLEAMKKQQVGRKRLEGESQDLQETWAEREARLQQMFCFRDQDETGMIGFGGKQEVVKVFS